ncbi:MAG TPA: tRNA preQ1(34) S-adenosylmethionine ribosyltransferase-isomerase QueA [Terriglobia bacterium]|nr:tRNA preQ1(34) S-adenosylmethionine ribosyltransferase-isomerase QueA [Terriglobia bacterium]
MHTSDFDYPLPAELIAKTPTEPRDAARMMVVDPRNATIIDSHFQNIADFLHPSDVLVLNDTRVIRARTRARLERRNGTSREMEVFFAQPTSARTWQVLCRPGRRIRRGDRAVFGNGEFVGTFQDSLGSDLHILELEAAELILDRFGEIPLPPYIERAPTATDDVSYQTVFGVHPGAVAAPTAGLHFTPAVLDSVRSKGIDIAMITLHVGIGTFLPVRTENPEDHTLRPERFEVRPDTALLLQTAMNEGRSIIAVGTTTIRTLEYLMLRYGRIQAVSGNTDLYILPGFDFRVVGGLLTNFHLPRSTLLMLVSAFAGRELTLRAYEHAVRDRYRFYSYGDCMLIKKSL